jgi:hypothetical protein
VPSSGPDPNYTADTLNRLRQAGIEVDRDFAPALRQFIASGVRRVQRERESQERFEAAQEQLIEAMLAFAAETDTHIFNANVFDRIKRRVCPGFWPFC